MTVRLVTACAAFIFTTASLSAAEPAAHDRSATVQAEFGFRLIDRLAAEQGGTNVIVSPASVAAMLAFLDLGADARMRAALAKTLGYGADEGPSGLEALRTEAKVLAGLPPEWGPLAFANAIFVDPAANVFPEALAELAGGMTAEVAEINEPKELAAINAWVEKTTRGAIPTILEEPLTGGGAGGAQRVPLQGRLGKPVRR